MENGDFEIVIHDHATCESKPKQEEKKVPIKENKKPLMMQN
jgi:hypothetical protein